jgi:hypothetical protein
MSTVPARPDPGEFHRLVGELVEVSAQLEFTMAGTLAVMVSRGDARVGLLVIAGESVTWVTGKMERIGKRYPNQVPGLATWASQCKTAFDARNRVIHDWLAEDGQGDRTAIRFTRKDTSRAPFGLEQRPKAVEEVREALATMKKTNTDFSALIVRLGDRLASLDPDEAP